VFSLSSDSRIANLHPAGAILAKTAHFRPAHITNLEEKGRVNQEL
jgi:hypothetical protein